MTTTSNTQTFAVDPAHSSVEFVVRHMMIAKVRGRFTGVVGTIDIPSGSQVPSSVTASLDTATVSTGDAQRDGHLKSPDFFDAEKHTHITFASTAIAGAPDDFEITGDLTIIGVTKSVTLKATYEGETVDPYGNTRYGYEAHGKISRKEFGLVFNMTLEAGGVAIGDDVKIELSIEGIAPKA